MYYTSPSVSKDDFEHIKDARKRAMTKLRSENRVVNIYERRRGFQGQVFLIKYKGKKIYGFRTVKGVSYEIKKDGTLKR